MERHLHTSAQSHFKYLLKVNDDIINVGLPHSFKSIEIMLRKDN